MPLENLNNAHYTAAEKTATQAAITALQTTLAAKFRNLEPADRKRYGSINEQNKLVVGKVHELKNSHPALCASDVDWTEFQNDYDSRMFIQATIAHLQDLIDGLNNNKILHDFDNYQAALTDYGYSQYKAGTKTAGFENKVNEISQFFKRPSPTTTSGSGS